MCHSTLWAGARPYFVIINRQFFFTFVNIIRQDHVKYHSKIPFKHLEHDIFEAERIVVKNVCINLGWIFDLGVDDNFPRGRLCHVDELLQCWNGVESVERVVAKV